MKFTATKEEPTGIHVWKLARRLPGDKHIRMRCIMCGLTGIRAARASDKRFPPLPRGGCLK